MYEILIQQTTDKAWVPDHALLEKTVLTTLKNIMPSAELTIRIVDETEMLDLNSRYRKKNKTTNVLSFPSDIPQELMLDLPLLGDIVICAAVVNQEAKEQHKTPQAHWTHMLVHGTFHLLGYDHETEDEAQEMESLEIAVMAELGFDNPYQLADKS